MQVSVAARDGLVRQMTIRVPMQTVEEQVRMRLLEIQNTAQLPGFRPGKTPPQIIKKRFYEPARAEVMDKVIRESLERAFAQEQLEPVAVPKIDVSPIENPEELVFSAEFEVLPEFELADLTQIKLKRTQVTISEKDIDNMIEQMRKQRVTFETVARAAAREDQVLFDFEGKADEVPFDGGTGSDYKLVLGSGRTISGFEEGMIGHKAGESFDVHVTFPADHPEVNLAGKNAVFHITLKEVESPKLPEVNEEFFKLFDIPEGGAAAFRQQVLESMNRIVRQIQRTQCKHQILEQLLRLHEFSLPASMVADEVHRLLHAEDEYGGEHDHHHTLESHGPIDPLITQDAQERVKLGLIGRKLMVQYNIYVTHSDIETRVDDLVKQYAYPEMMKKYLLQNEYVLRDLEGRTLEEKILDVILEQTKISDEATSYEELVKQGK